MRSPPTSSACAVYNREFVRRWWNWQEYLACEHPAAEQTFETFERILEELYNGYTFELAERESGVSAEVLREIADAVGSAGTRLSTHNWRSAAAGNLGGWQVTRCLFLLNALLGAVATEGGTHPNAWNKFVPRPIYTPPHPTSWNELTWPEEYPLAMNELSFLLPHFLKEGRGRLEVYFTRVYNPVWTNPDGFSWIEVLTDRGARRSPRRSDADLERDRLPRRLRTADGTRVGAARPPFVRAVRRPVDRLPAARAEGGT